MLDAWSGRRDERDIVIKTNTGGGKTIVRLLMLQCCLHEKKGPALYLAPDPHLAKRVCGEAANLGLDVVSDPESVKFISGQAICVTTMRTLVNGRTRFGLAGPGGRQLRGLAERPSRRFRSRRRAHGWSSRPTMLLTTRCSTFSPLI